MTIDDADANGSVYPSGYGYGEGSFNDEGEIPGYNVDSAGVLIIEDEFLGNELSTRGGGVTAVVVVEDDFLGCLGEHRSSHGGCDSNGGLDKFLGEYGRHAVFVVIDELSGEFPRHVVFGSLPKILLLFVISKRFQ